MSEKVIKCERCGMCFHKWKEDFKDIIGQMKPGDLSETKECVKCGIKKYKSWPSGYWFIYPDFLEESERMKLEIIEDFEVIGYGYVIPKGTILTYIGDTHHLSGSKFKDEKGNQHNFDNSELLFSGKFKNVGG